MPPPQAPQQQFPAPAPQAPEQSPYEFFMEPDAGKKKGPSFSGGAGGLSPKTIIIAIVGLFVLVGVIGTIVTVIGSDKGPTPLGSVVGTQQEIIRVAADGSKNSKNNRLQNFAITTEVSMSSAQLDTIAQLGKLGVKVDAKDLGAIRNAQTDKALAASIPASTYDSTFTSIMKTELNTYQTRLIAARAVATTKAEVDLIKKLDAGAKLLQQQLATP